MLPLRRVVVQGPSMAPTLHHGDRLLVWLRAPRRTPAVGRIVLVNLPGRPLSVKRLTAAEDGDGLIRIQGDNEFASTDSRQLGSLPASLIDGIVLCRFWPRPRRFVP
ncbi:MAG TPA: S24 family peptidase [Mycobacteriales bacterium]|jgi:nickel-type superoxide dismutase maturation protease|nr:S24 family peptidase [Mycobacteriales bacterium]